MPPHNVAALVHLVGFLTGAALYAMLFALVLRRRVGDDRLPLGTAILGLLWNVSGLAAFGIRDFAGCIPGSAPEPACSAQCVRSSSSARPVDLRSYGGG